MTTGSPDYTKLVQILGKDVDGNLVAVRVDPYGRIILLPYGVMNVTGDVGVTQAEKDRIMQGADGETLHTVAVDSAGRLVMLPYGFNGVDYTPLRVDEDGRMVSVMKGQADVKWGLVGWWKFVGSEGTTIKDYSGNGNNGRALSGVTPEAKYQAGVIGQALQFDGTYDHVNCGTDSSLDFTTGNFSVEFWLKAETAAGVGVVVFKGKSAQAGYYIALNPAGYLYMKTSQDGATQVTQSYPDIVVETWYHVVAIRDGTKGYIYINGVDRTDIQENIIDPVSSPLAFSIGAYEGNSSYYKGLFDEVRVYSRALSPDEIAWRYEQTNPTNPKPTRMIAVDGEGRMRVSVEGFPYKSQVLEKMSDTPSSAGNYTLQATIVPPGKIHVLNVCNAWIEGQAVDMIDIVIHDGVTDYPLAYEYGSGTVIRASILTPLILKAGDYLMAGYTAVPSGTKINLVINGYELDAME